MKYLFVIQGEGRGHLMQAIALRNMLVGNGHTVLAVLIGRSERRELPEFFYEKIHAPVMRFDSPNFAPSAKNKRVNIWTTIAWNLPKIGNYLRSIRFIHKQINTSEADLVVNFYEIMAGLTYLLFPPRKPCVSVAHQYLFLHSEYRFPPLESGLELWMLRLFTALTRLRSKKVFALSIKQMPDLPGKRIRVVPPLLRNEVLQCLPTKGDYLLGYLLNESYAEEITAYQQAHPEMEMHFFWDKKGVPPEVQVNDGLSFHLLNDQLFIHYMAGCGGYATTAGFESVCEAMYLGKPVLMVPTHIEQSCNAFEAAGAGAGIVSENFDLDALLAAIPRYRGNDDFRRWMDQSESIWLRELESVLVSV
jgi:uncharacterized protein (TIGR00661 family)